MLHARALHGNPFDDHTLGAAIADLEQITGVETRRIHVDKGYRGHDQEDLGVSEEETGFNCTHSIR